MAAFKTLEFPNTAAGQSQKNRALAKHTVQGWTVVSEILEQGKFKGGKACCMGGSGIACCGVFGAPLGFAAGHTQGIIRVTLSRESHPTTDAQPPMMASGQHVRKGSGTKFVSVLALSAVFLICGCCILSLIVALVTQPTDVLQPRESASAKPMPAGDASVSQTGPVAIPDEESTSEYRIWTDSTGEYTVEAKFLHCTAGTVKLKSKDNGQEIALPLQQLSSEDQDWIEARGRQRRATLTPRSKPESERVSDDSSPTEEPIPGLTAVDIHGNLTNKGFSLRKNLGISFSEWRCSQNVGNAEYVAEALGSGPTSIAAVRGTVINYTGSGTNELAAEFLGFLASLPYEGAEPAKAKQWVVTNVGKGKNSETVIGGVRFQLFANGPSSRMLRITKAP